MSFVLLNNSKQNINNNGNQNSDNYDHNLVPVSVTNVNKIMIF